MCGHTPLEQLMEQGDPVLFGKIFPPQLLLEITYGRCIDVLWLLQCEHSELEDEEAVSGNDPAAYVLGNLKLVGL